MMMHCSPQLVIEKQGVMGGSSADFWPWLPGQVEFE